MVEGITDKKGRRQKQRDEESFDLCCRFFVSGPPPVAHCSTVKGYIRFIRETCVWNRSVAVEIAVKRVAEGDVELHTPAPGEEHGSPALYELVSQRDPSSALRASR